MTPTFIVVSILATWRLTSFLHYEDGPLALFSATRRALRRLGLGPMVDCFHCVAFWAGAVAVVLLYEPSAVWVILILAVSGGASIIELAVGGRGREEAEEAGQQ